jgi:enoyl-CoA hydratase/carnithine racemase
MTVHYHLENGVATFTLENERLNLLTMGMHEQFHHYFLEFLEDDEARVGILTGAGDNFSAGDNLNESDTEVKSRRKPRWDELTLTHPRNKPIVAAVNGYCFGEGLVYLMNLTDVRIAGDTLTIGAPEISYGMGGMSGGTHMGSQLSYIHAAWICLTGEKFDAQRALSLDLVNEVVAADTCLSRAREVADQIAKHPLIAIKTELECLQRSVELSRIESLRYALSKYQVQRDQYLASGVAALSHLENKKNKD